MTVDSPDSGAFKPGPMAVWDKKDALPKRVYIDNVPKSANEYSGLSQSLHAKLSPDGTIIATLTSGWRTVDETNGTGRESGRTKR
jgi:hypothetical protein